MRTGEEFDLGPLRWESIVSRHSKTGFRFITGVSILNSLWNMQSGRKHVIGDWFILFAVEARYSYFNILEFLQDRLRRSFVFFLFFIVGYLARLPRSFRLAQDSLKIVGSSHFPGTHE